MNRLKNLILGMLLTSTLLGCSDGLPRVEEMENAVVYFRNVDHNLHTYYWLKGDLTLSFYENYVKVEESRAETVHFIPLDKVVYIGDLIEIQ
ncbi:hypothetical protein [Aliikangiella coralliicola]|uniref:Uncharacterized protein n=1 Tax=Aliikangiella coralliicola TaxID=2592383 RepID=A0A545U6A1_9GAMM|nr:hypothetical protein [Aliikangiella coralliicola]TQV84933.1 hypothetical protein FLL46_21295 [Aliikangiella coralliicola]